MTEGEATVTENTPLCPATDIAEGKMRLEMLPNGTLIALHNVGGRIYATADLCTHAAASLSEEGTLNGKIVECGWHYGRFDVTTGEPCGSPCEVPLKTYRVALIDGIVHVEV